MRQTVNLKFLGRFGNRLFQYAFARAYCERFGHELRTEPWVGQSLFGLIEKPIEKDYPVVGEEIIPTGHGNVTIYCYAQTTKCLDLYDPDRARSWFYLPPSNRKIKLAFHLRRGDYFQSGYPVISRKAYENAARRAGYDPAEATIFTDGPKLEHDDTNMVEDFVAMRDAEVLFRGNSSYSWWAAALGRGKVFSPFIDNLNGGVEHDEVPFMRGNWPRLANLSFTEQLYFGPEYPHATPI